MAALSLICYACQRNAVEVSGVVQECVCGCRKMVAAPYRPPMNWQELARRGEAHAERLAVALSVTLTLCEEAAVAVPSDCRAIYDDAQPALDAWAAHRADLETLEGKA